MSKEITTFRFLIRHNGQVAMVKREYRVGGLYAILTVGLVECSAHPWETIIIHSLIVTDASCQRLESRQLDALRVIHLSVDSGGLRRDLRGDFRLGSTAILTV